MIMRRMNCWRYASQPQYVGALPRVNIDFETGWVIPTLKLLQLVEKGLNFYSTCRNIFQFIIGEIQD